MNALRSGLGVGLLAAAVTLGGPPAAWGIEYGDAVPASVIPSTGAVRLTRSECSGMLVTPFWVLTAGHCGADPGFAVLGNANDSSAPRAPVAKSFPHWNYEYGEPAYDARLVLLADPLYPRFANGSLWIGYKRDLYRGDIQALENGDQHADVYGYGATDEAGTGKGTLRYAWFRIDDVSSTVMEIDGHVEVHGGDSGAAVLVPAQYGIAAVDAYRIAAVMSTREVVLGNAAGLAAHAAAIAPWFDSVIGYVLRPFDQPAQLMTILGVR
jgi:hypothetical protein